MVVDKVDVGGRDRLLGKIMDLSNSHNLTRKETVILNHLAVGDNAKEISKKEGITYQTARWYIKQIYQKIGISKQTELMWHLLS